MTTKVRALLGLIVAVAALGVVSCDHYVCTSGATFGGSCTAGPPGIGQPGPGTQSAFVFFVDDQAKQLSLDGLNVANSGTFAPISNFVSPTLTSTIISDEGMVIVNKKFLYLPFFDGELFAFAINASTGALTPVNASIPQYLVAGGATSIAADPKGKVLFVGGGGGITEFTINATDGTLSSPSFVATGLSPSQMTTDGLGTYLYAILGSSVGAYTYANGTPASVGGPFTFTNNGAQVSLQQIQGEKTGKFLVGITKQDGRNGGLVDDNIYVLSIAQSGNGAGSLTLSSVLTTDASPVFIAVSPTAEFVYTFNDTFPITQAVPEPMEGFSLSAQGQLTALGVSGPAAQLGRFDQSGGFIFARLQVVGAEETLPLAVDQNGNLTTPLPNTGSASNVFAVTDEP